MVYRGGLIGKRILSAELIIAQALLLLHECNRAVTVSVDRQYLILHRDLLTEYAQPGGGASA